MLRVWDHVYVLFSIAVLLVFVKGGVAVFATMLAPGRSLKDEGVGSLGGRRRR